MSSAMEEIIKRCSETLDFVSGKEIPKTMWKHCKGIAIINISEKGLVFSIGEGDGVIMGKNDDGTWSAPSCIMYTSASGGVVVGKAEKKLVLLPMTKNGINQLTANSKYQLGAIAGLTAGAVGREAALALDAGGHGVGGTFSYLFSEGVLVDFGITNNIIDNVNEANEVFYGKEGVTPNEIVFDGAVEIPAGKGVEELQAKLKALSDPEE